MSAANLDKASSRWVGGTTASKLDAPSRSPERNRALILCSKSESVVSDSLAEGSATGTAARERSNLRRRSRIVRDEGASGINRMNVLITFLGVSRHKSVPKPPELTSSTPTVSPVRAPRLSTLIPDFPTTAGSTGSDPPGAGVARGPGVGSSWLSGEGLTLNSRGLVGSRDRGVWAPADERTKENAARKPSPVKARRMGLAWNRSAPLARQLLIRDNFLYRFRRWRDIPGRQERETSGDDRDHDRQNDNSRLHTLVPTIPSSAPLHGPPAPRAP